jgi:hypothetical protein
MNSPIISFANVEKSLSDNTSQIAENFKTYRNGLVLAQPVTAKAVLLDACKNSSVNMRCIATIAATVAGIGYEFEDKENAEASGVLNFVDSLVDRNGNPLPLAKLLCDWYADYKMFGESHLEVARQAGIIANLLLLSAKNVYTDLDRTFLAQVIQMGEKSNQFKIFRPYSEYTSTERDCISLVRQTAFDDVYGVPVYISALPAITSNRKIGEANIESMDNTIRGSIAIELSGEITPDQQLLVSNAYKALKNRKGGTAIIHLPTGVTANVRTMGSTSVDGDYLKEREKNELEIMALHGVPAELYGTMQTGGISSGDKATGALKVFIQTVVRPEQEMLSKLFDNILKQEFKGYKGGFKLKQIDLTDWLEDQQAAQMQANIQQTYVNLGSLKLLNEYRESIQLEPLTGEEFAVITANNIQPNFSQPAF